MALRASELLLIVRAQNQASQALRRIATDVGSLNSVQGLQARQAALRIQQDKIATQQIRAMNEVQSISAANGKRRLAQDEAVLRNQRQMVESQARLTALQKEYNMTTTASGATRYRNSMGKFVPEPAVIQAATMRVRELAIAQEKLAAQETVLAQRTTVLNAELATLEKRNAMLIAQQKALSDAITSARWGRLSAVGSTMQHTARIVQMGGLVVGAALGYAGAQAAKFQSEVTLAATQSRDAGASFTQTAGNAKILQSAILNMMKAFPTSSQEMTQAAYDIYSSLNLGKGRAALNSGIRLLRMMNQAAVAGQTSLQDVTNATISLMNDFRIKVGGVTNALQIMFASVKYGRMTFQEFTQMMPQMAPAFAAAGYGMKEMAQAAAFMTRVIPNTSRAATALARLTEMFARKDFIDGAKKMGVNITDLHNRLLPLPVIIEKLAKGFPQLISSIKSGKGDVGLQNFFKEVTALGSGGKGTTGTIQGRRAFTFFVTQLGLAHQVYGQVAKDQKAFTDQLKSMEASTGVKWGTFINNLKAVGLEIGVAVLPALLKMATYVERAVHWWESLSQSTKNQITTWAAYGAAIAVVGSALLWLLGLGVRIFAMVGKVGGLFSALTLTILAVATAVSALGGHWSGLNGIINTFFGFFASQGVWGWVAYFGIAALGAIKLARGIIAVRDAYVTLKAAVAAQGALKVAGGLLAGRGVAGVAGGIGEAGAVEGGVALEGAATGIAASLGGAAIAIGTLGIGLGVAAAAAGIWYLHQKEVAHEAAETKREMEAIAVLQRRSMSTANQAGNFGMSMRDVTSARNAVGEIRLQLRGLKKELAGSTGDERRSILYQISDTRIQLANALDDLHRKINVANTDFRAFERNAASVRTNNITLAEWGKQLARDQKVLQEYAQWADKHPMGQSHGVNPFRDQADSAREEIKHLQQDIQTLSVVNQQAATKMGRSWNKAIRDLMTGGFIQKAPQSVINSMMLFQQQLGRMMTQKEMKMFIKAELDPKSLKDTSKQMRDFIKAQSAVSKAGAFIGKAAKSVLSAFGIVPSKQTVTKAASEAQKSAVDFYAKHPAKLQTHVLPPKMEQLNKIGQDITSGIQAGMDAKGINETVTVIVNKYVKSFKVATETHSPSKLFAREIGEPIGQGIIQGVLNTVPGMQKTAVLTMQLFAGAFIQARESAFESFKSDPLKMKLYLARADEEMKRYRKTHNQSDLLLAQQNRKRAQQVAPISMKDLIIDTQKQAQAFAKFNAEIRKLTPKIPRDMLEAIKAMGIDGLKYLTILANASDRQLKKLVKAWKDAQREAKKAQSVTLDDQKQFADQAAQNLLDLYNQLRSVNEQNFGELFAGLGDKVGQGYQDALNQYKQTQADLQGQLADLNQQLADAYKEMADRKAQAIAERTAQLQEQMGQLFKGDWLTGDIVQSKLQWGQKLGFDDLFKDLQGQVDKFKRWRQDLIDIAKRVPPELAKQLEALGPDAMAQIEALNGSTDDQLAKYITLWQEGQTAIGDIAKNTVVDVSDIMAHINDILKQIDIVTQQLAALQQPQELTGQDIIDDLQKQMDQWDEYQKLLDDLAAKGVPQEIIDQLAQMGPQAIPYLQALIAMTGPQLDEFVKLFTERHKAIDEATTKMMNRQLKLWYTHGKNIAAAIIAGTASEQAALLEFFRNMFLDLLKGKFPQVDTTPPADNSGSGGSSGSSDGPGSNFGNSPSSSQYFDQFGAPASQTTVVNQTVYATQTESLQSTLDRATFRIINRTS